MIVSENTAVKPRKVEPPVALPKPEGKPSLAPVAAADQPILIDSGATTAPAAAPIASPAKAAPLQLGGTTLTSSAGDGFGSGPAPTATPGGVEMGGTTLTSTAGDGFGAGPAAPATALPPAPAAPAPAALPPSPAAPAAAGVAPNLTPTNPDNPLTAQTIQPGNALDRFKVAQEQYDTFVKSTDPAYQAALRDANRLGAAAGGLGSGQLRTSFGDLAANRGTQLDTKRDTVFQDALLGGVDDSRFATGVAQQQQGFQNSQQQQAFMNELSRLGFDDSMLNSAFGRSLQTWMAGQTGGTGSASSAAYGANVAGQGNDALAALANLIRSNAAATTPAAPAQPPASLPAGVDASKIFPWM